MSGLKLRSLRLKDGYSLDSLTNALTGQGTGADPRMANAYARRELTEFEIAAAYDGSGMMAKVIDIPALDMVREWRNWQAEASQITMLEAEEKRLAIRAKIRLVETYRGLGGGALLLGLPGDMDKAIDPKLIRKGGLEYIHVVMRYQLTLGPEVEDHRDPRFGGPEFFKLNSTAGEMEIHPSRVVCFKGDPVLPVAGMTWEGRYWGKSRVARVLDAVQNCDSAQGAFAGLITKARNVIIGIPGLLDLVGTKDGEAALQRRLQAMILGEGLYNATLRDAGDGTPGAGETIDHRQVNWAGIPEIMMAFASFLAAVSDIPATRLLGKSPDGMNSTGAGDDRNWNKMVKAKQELELGPCMEQLDAFLVPSAGIADAADIYCEWAPLDTPTEKEMAETFKLMVDAIEKLQATNTVPDKALAKAVQNMLVEGAYLPGIEGALAEIPETERYGLEPPDDGSDPSALQAGKALPGPVNDAMPRPLYVQRKLLNAKDVIDWAKSQGFTRSLPASDMHVTILYSRSPVDPMKMGEGWAGDEQGRLRVKPGGPRALEVFGQGAVVLQFASSDLVWRHKSMIEAGGSHDFDEYHPHITLTYELPEGVDLETVKPYAGELLFGPELFEPLDLDWKSKVAEH